MSSPLSHKLSQDSNPNNSTITIESSSESSRNFQTIPSPHANVFDILFNQTLINKFIALLQASQNNFLANNPNYDPKYLEKFKMEITPNSFLAFLSSSFFIRYKKPLDVHTTDDMFGFLRDVNNIHLPLGKKRFKALTQLFNFSRESIKNELLPEINKSSRGVFTGRFMVAFDEHNFEYNISNEAKENYQADHDECPKATIRGKPRPTGIWIFKSTFMTPVSNTPYTLDFRPIMQSGDCPMRQLFLEAAEKIPGAHFIIDSRLGGIDFFTELPHGVLLTCALKNHEKKWIWQLLERDLQVGYWCGILLGNVCLSVERNMENRTKPIFYLLATNAFDFLSKPIELAEDPLFSISQEELKSMSAAEVKQFKLDMGLKATKTKTQQINSITKLQTPERKQISREKVLLDSLAREKIKGDARHHSFYHDNFNSVDLSNREFHRQAPIRFIQHWRSKLVLSLIDELMTNAWSLRCEFGKVDRIDFAVEIANSIHSQIKKNQNDFY